jgi:predicted MPP superfamily phosphohydrolase
MPFATLSIVPSPRAPDLIVVTGDVVDSPEDRPGRMAARARRLRAPHGVVAILGNHDLEVGLDRVAAALRAATDWTVLRDQSIASRTASSWSVSSSDGRRTR